LRAPERQTAILRGFVGRTLDERYRIEESIATGGMGAVFRAQHLKLQRDVALKILHPELTLDSRSVKRFEREAHSSSRLDHVNCVRVTDYGVTSDGVMYLVMELIDGGPLTELLGEPLPPARAVAMVSQILEGLDAAHHGGIVHRDLKPENILVSRDHRGRETLKIVDFGIAKLLEDSNTRTRLTQTGFIFGTPRYMSPEQAMGEPITAQTDQYPVGLILYEMIAGRHAFAAAQDVHSLIEAHVTSQHDPLPSDVPPQLASIIDRLLAKTSSARFASAREALDALDAIRPSLDYLGPSKAAQAPTADRELPQTKAVPRSPDMPQPAPVTPDVTADVKRVVGTTPEFTAEGHAFTSPSVETTDFQPRSSALPAIAIVGIMAVVGAAAGGAWLYAKKSGEVPVEDVPVTAQAAPTPTPEPGTDPPPSAPTPTPEPIPEAETVTLEVRTNVEAVVLNATSGEVYGKTNDETGIKLARGDDALNLVLRSEGHDDLLLDFVPNADQEIVRELSPSVDEGKKKGRKRGGNGKASTSKSAAGKKSGDKFEIPLDKVRDPFGK
jgi:serine/threonine protein kinase